eukprot:ANDGO_04488.mRNA.1 hypothetical protein
MEKWESLYVQNEGRAPWDSFCASSQLIAWWKRNQHRIPGLSTCLEVGCGTGASCAWMAEHMSNANENGNGRVVGVDISPTAIACAQKRQHQYMQLQPPRTVRLCFVCADMISSTEFMDQHAGTADFLLDVQVTHVLGIESVRTIWKLARAGGTVLSIAGSKEYYMKHPWLSTTSAPCVWSREEYQSIWESVGFETVACEASRFDPTSHYANTSLFSNGPPGCWVFEFLKKGAGMP